MVRPKKVLLMVLLCGGVALVGCPGEEPVDEPDVGPDVEEDVDPGEDVDEPDAEPDVDPEPMPTGRTVDCDALMEAYCSMPWPSSLYLEADEERATGYTLDFGSESLPRSELAGHIQPGMFRRLDGYGLGTPVAVLFPGVDVDLLPGELSIEDSVEDPDRRAFYFEVTDDGLELVPFWAEVDLWTEEADEQVLYLRPAVILKEDTRYVVGFRNLVDTDGDAFERSEAFEKYLSGEAAEDPELAFRQERFDEIFDWLEAEGIERDELTLAWDFHTGSSDGLHGKLLHIVEEGLAAADVDGLPITITSVTRYDEGTDSSAGEDPNMAFRIAGTLEVPHFLERSNRTGALAFRFHRDEDGRPAIFDTRQARFWMLIPHSALDGTPHGLVKYGHGMLGSGEQVFGGFNRQIANDHHLIFFGADFIGFSSEDVPQATFALQQPTYFEEMVDRMHQGVLEWVLLTRAMREQVEDIPGMLDGINDVDTSDVTITLDEDRIYYSGISQGGIYGVTYLAVDPTVTHGHFGVPGHNYAMLMERSSNYTTYYPFVAAGFPNRVDQSMVIPMIMLLWDQIDPISYLRRLTAEPFDPERPKYGLFATAKGDYQVAVVTKEITARSGIEIPLLENYDREREPWGGDWASYDHEGSGIVNWDFSNPWPEPGNMAPDDEYGDPHGQPRRRHEDHNVQMVHFFDTGEIIDVCEGEPCYFPREPRD